MRLQAQKGHFLYVPFDGIEKYYRFDRILFPFNATFEKITSGNIYPKEKSALETHLDYFFTSEYRSNNMDRIVKWLGEDKVRHIPKHEIFDYITTSCNPHYSWRRQYTNDWHITVLEHWENIANNGGLLISLPYSSISKQKVSTITEVIEKMFNDNLNCRDLISKITIQRVKLPFSKRMYVQINRGATLIWNGMRKLPYTNNEIALALGRFVVMMYFDNEYDDNREYKPLMGRTVYIGLASVDGSNTKSYVSGLNALESKRRNILKYVNDEFRNICSNNPVALTQLINRPSYLFTFEGFRKLFVLDVIPSQTVLTINDDNPIIYFNPVIIEVFGLA